ncbi:MAG: hypothetical protein WD396_04560 [Pseudohongiellaceae bacterium]
MKTRVLLALVTLSLSACVSTEGMPSFESMSTEELATYNRDRPIDQMIVCTEDQRSLSRVRRRRCMTVEQAYGSAAQAEQIGVLNSIPGIQ